jgi:alpha-tubulin suppressor-like RCC1 family protein
MQITPYTTTTITLEMHAVVTTTANVDFTGTAIAIAASSSSTFAVLNDGTVWAWGENDEEETGATNFGPGQTRLYALYNPVQVPGVTGATQVAAGRSSACALTNLRNIGVGQVYCWGRGLEGQIGDGTTTPMKPPTPISIPGNPDVSAMALVAGDTNVCVTSAPPGQYGATWCWGNDTYGQIDNVPKYSLPTPTIMSSPFALGAMGTGAICGLLPSADSMCWGNNNNGQFGANTITSNGVRTMAFPGLPIVQIAIANGSICALQADSTVVCAGMGYYGELANGTTGSGTVQKTPLAVPGLSGVTSLVAANTGYSYYALRNDGTVWAWGRNNAGQLGDLSETNRTAPVQVRNLYGVVQVVAGFNHACARKNDGSVWCWGENGLGQIGDGSQMRRFAPTRVQF